MDYTNYTNSTDLTLNNSNRSYNGVDAPRDTPEDTVMFVLNEIVIPTISVLGMLGNGLNLLVLWCRYRRRDIDIMEKGALLGLLALAVSDMAFCLVIFPHAFLPRKVWFTNWGLHMNYQLYSLYFQNVFIKTSTWLTLVVGFARYVGICHPLRARLCIGLCGIRVAVLLTFAFWFLAEAPLLWTYAVQDISIRNTTYYYIDVGDFAANKTMEDCFTYLWAILGYVMPMAILIYCNGNLIHALHQSRKLRQEASVRNDSNMKDANTRITITLIVLILMFMILVSPSEIIHFLNYTGSESLSNYQSYKIGMAVCNVLQAVNFACNFILYCAVNATFRRTISGWFESMKQRFSRPAHALEIDNTTGKGRSSSSSSNTQQRTTYYSALKQSVTQSQNSLIASRQSKWNETCNM